MSGMVDHLVMVNGLPGSGKTTLATSLAAALAAPLVSKDALKEAIAGVAPAASSSTLGAVAMEAAWSLAASMRGTVVIESWWFKPRDLPFAEAGLRRCRARSVVEVWCQVPADVARRRCETRRRHPVHDDVRRIADSWTRWAALAEPLGVGRTLRINTEVPVEIGDVASECTKRQTV
jgi:predicted kinase